MRTKNLIHPGEILQEEFLVPLGISQTRLALDLHVPAPPPSFDFAVLADSAMSSYLR